MVKHNLGQYIFESLMVASLAFICSVLLFAAFLPTVNLIVEKNFSLLSLLNSQALIVFTIVFFLIVIAGNVYPIFYSFKNSTMQGLKGFSKLGNNKLRKILVTGQLAFTAGLIFFTITVHDQLNFIKTKDFGFKDDKVIIVSLPDDITRQGQLPEFIKDLHSDNSIKAVSLINKLSFPGSEHLDYQLGWIYNNDNRIEANYGVYEVDSLFTKLLDIQFLTGSNFSGLTNKSGQQAIVNKAFVKMAGFKNPESIMGETIYAFDDKMKIIGVVEDFNYQDFRKEVQPLIMVPINQASASAQKMLISLNDLNGLMVTQKAYQKLASQKPFEYTFLDERVKRMFEQEKTTGQVTEIFSLLAIVLAGIGLYSLSNLILAQRTKEIGIRKILGITQRSLLVLISKEFFILSLLAFFIAIPFAWMQGQQWLSNYAFKTNITVFTLGLTYLEKLKNKPC